MKKLSNSFQKSLKTKQKVNKKRNTSQFHGIYREFSNSCKKMYKFHKARKKYAITIYLVEENSFSIKNFISRRKH